MKKEFLRKMIEDSIQLQESFFAKNLDTILRFEEMLRQVWIQKKKVFIFGNGGSAADAQHFAAELMHRVEKKPIGMRALSLHTDTSLLTALGNDEGFVHVYSRQIDVLAEREDLAVAISTSGTSPNIVEALRMARSRSCRTAGLLGRDGGSALALCDLAIVVPHASTPRIQEVHGMIIHLVCQLLEAEPAR